jgi:uncharacterized protein (DUF2384 family)
LSKGQTMEKVKSPVKKTPKKTAAPRTRQPRPSPRHSKWTLEGLKDAEVLHYMEANTVDASFIDAIKKMTRYKESKIAGWLRISERTMRTYQSENKVLEKGLSEQVVMLRTVMEKGKAVFGESDAFDKWLDMENFFFDGKKPSSYMDTTSGLRYIFDRLTAMEYGDNV